MSKEVETMVIYTYDPVTKDLLSYHVEEDGYQLLPNETTLPLPDGIKHPKLVDGKWVGDPLAGVKNDGKSQDQINASLIKQVAQLSIASDSKDKLNAQLIKDVAGLKIQLGSLQGQVEETKAQATAALAEPTQPTQPKED